MTDRRPGVSLGTGRLPMKTLLVLLVTVSGLLLTSAMSGTAEASPVEVTRFPIPGEGSEPMGITVGPDGNMWFAQFDEVGRINSSGQITEFPFPSKGSGADEIVAGSDGNVWFTRPGWSQIDRITPAGQITEFRLGKSEERYPQGIAAGSDGNLWFTQTKPNEIGTITPNGQITMFPLPNGAGTPIAIAAGPEGDLWFSQETEIGRITPSGQVTEFPIPSGDSSLGEQRTAAITVGPDGNLWFTVDIGGPFEEDSEGKIGRITPTGQITEYRLLASEGKLPGAIAPGPEGDLWFTYPVQGVRGPYGGYLGRMTTRGRFTLFSTTGAGGAPFGIAAGPDDTLWYTASTRNDAYGPGDAEIGRFSPPPPEPLAMQIATWAPVRYHWAKIRLSCEGGASTSTCSGNLELHIAGSKNLFARRGYRLPTQTTRRFAVRLNQQALSLLTHHRPLRAQATATVSGSQSTSQEVFLQR